MFSMMKIQPDFCSPRSSGLILVHGRKDLLYISLQLLSLTLYIRISYIHNCFDLKTY